MENEEQVDFNTTEETQDVEMTEAQKWFHKPEDEWTVEDAAEAKKSWKTVISQKEHFKKKATELKTQPKPEKQESQNTGLTREEAILFAKGFTEDEVDLANKIAKVNGIPVIEATNDDYFKSVVEKRKEQERSSNAQLRPSNGYQAKDVSKMTTDEHRNAFLDAMSG